MTAPASDAPPRTWRPSRVVVIVAVVLMLAMWGYVLYLAFGPGRQPSPDRLADPSFAEQSQVICQAAHEEVDRLPSASNDQTAAERADIVEQATDRFTTMIDDIEPLAPEGEDGEVVAEWIADWRTYLGDREAYVEALRTEPDPRFFVTAKDNSQVTEFIDGFAADNHMAACATPLDLG